jgi:hypothetical protein
VLGAFRKRVDVKEPLKVGDRVAVYSGNKMTGIILAIDKPTEYSGPIQVKIDDPSCMVFVHSKQCRRLKKVRPREWWINFYNNGGGDVAHPTEELANEHYVNGRKELVHVREVKVKK